MLVLNILFCLAAEEIFMHAVMNLGSIISNSARRYPERIGLVQGSSNWTWLELTSNVDAMAISLKNLGLGKGDRVMVQCQNNRYLFECMYAIVKIGAVYVPINARSTTVETLEMVDLCDAKAFIVDSCISENGIDISALDNSVENVIFAGKLPSDNLPGGNKLENEIRNCWSYDDLIYSNKGKPFTDEAVVYDDICWHSFTSGTTGVPKGALTTHGGMQFVINNRLADVVPNVDLHHALLAIGPLTHGTGTASMVNVSQGAKTVLLSSSRFDEGECWQLIEEQKITTLFTVPTILMRLLKHPDAENFDSTSLQHVVYAGAPITQSDQKIALNKFGSKLVQYYGSAETLGAGTVLTPDMHTGDNNENQCPDGSCGIARTGTELKIVNSQMLPVAINEEGEICMRGSGVFYGYYNNPEANAEAFVQGWYRTGDLGRMDERGFVTIVGRTKELYKSGGLQVYPNEIQNHLAKHPAVCEAHVVSFPDSEWGEVGVAIVKLKAEDSATEGELIEFIRQQLSAYKQPKRIFIWMEIPKTPYGKVPKSLLRDALLERGLVTLGEDIQPYIREK